MSNPSRSIPTRTLLRRFIPYYRKYWKTLVFDLCCAALTTGGDTAFIYFQF